MDHMDKYYWMVVSGYAIVGMYGTGYILFRQTVDKALLASLSQKRFSNSNDKNDICERFYGSTNLYQPHFYFHLCQFL